MKASERIHELSERVASVEQNVAAAHEENMEKLTTRIDAAKADAETRRDAMTAGLEDMGETAKAPWISMRDTFNSHRAKVSEGISGVKDSVDKAAADDLAAIAELEAQAAVGFALVTIDEAEMAVIAAIEARAHADSL